MIQMNVPPPTAIDSVCALCGGEVESLYAGLAGYQAPHRYDVLGCSDCGVSFAYPGEPDPEVYELIYRNAWKTPGYSEYVEFTSGVLKASQPLDYLASSAPVYWAVREYLRAKPKSVRILELGCGMGYLTYAVAKAGYNIVGVDISHVAIERARRKYGDLYRQGDILDASLDLGSFDIVICTEVIEHVGDPVSMVAGVRKVLAHHGEALFSTPNKSAYPREAIWETDLPPVHLWWFTTRAIEVMARRTGYSSVRFLDLAACPLGRATIDPSRDYSQPRTRAYLDHRGRLQFPGRHAYALRMALRRAAGSAGALSAIRRGKRRIFGAPPSPPATGPHVNICAVLSK